MIEKTAEQEAIFVPDLWSGKMSQERSAQTKEKTSEQSSKKRSRSSAQKPPLFLCLSADGQGPDASLVWKESGALLGEYTTQSFGESPSEESASHLSQILEDSPPQKYYLSAKACLGILTRAKRRGEESAVDSERGPGTADRESEPIAPHLLQDPVQNVVSPCMGQGNSNGGQASIGVYSAGFKAGNGSNARSIGWQEEISPSLAAEGGGNSVPSVCIRERSLFENHGQGARYNGPLSTLLGRMGTGGNNTPLVVDKELPSCLTPWENQSRRIYSENGTFSALSARETAGQDQQAVLVKHIVRRLTPLECERLQGYPDGWTDIGDWVDTTGRKRKASDSIRHRSIGNSIALPFWQWLTRRISAQYDRPATLGSLFDGIGGFSYCWERCNGRGTVIWASEIDEFCIAVTERRINSPGIV